MADELEAADDAGLHSPARPGMGRSWTALRVDVGQQLRALVHLARWTVIGVVVGVVAGLSSAAFLETLSWATRTRIDHPNLLWGLPLFGLVCGLAYHHVGGRAGGGSSLIIDEVHDPRTWLPRRMAPLTFVFTVGGHLFGASVGREGTAIQMAAGLTDTGARALRIPGPARRILLIAAIAGGFGAVFGVPLAGAVFGLEVLAVGRIRYDALVPAFAASLVGDRVVAGLGVHHTPTPTLAAVDLDPLLLAKLALAGIAFGIAALVFAELTHGIKQLFAAHVRWPPARTFLGGVAVVALTYVVGDRAYLGLSIPLITGALAGGAGIVAGAFALKLLFTSVSLGAGFQGGEVTPLFVIGATLGVTLGRLLDVPIPLLAAVGFVAVFAGATNTPLACTIMAIELFGAAVAVPAAIGCVVAFVVSADRGIYASQRIDGDPDATIGSRRRS
ncbi:MAG: Chloride channel protein [Actinomycetia bacterium]|nr:Chloride channel protein [Actinomycetes bacterium]